MVEYASRHHGIVCWHELAAAGIAASTVRRWVQSGRLHRIHKGVYSVVPPAMLTQEARWYAAVMACGRPSFLCQAPSGQLQGFIDRGSRFALHVAHLERRAAYPKGVVVHRPRHFDPRDTTRCSGIPTMTPTRTVWDLAYSSSPRFVRDAFRKAEARDLVDRGRLTELADNHPRRRGTGLIRSIIEERRVPLSEVRSWLEALLVTICADNAVPFPAINVPLLDYTVDFLWVPERFVVEADGDDHLDREQRDKDNARDIALQRSGFMVRRYSSRDMGREREVAAEVLQILGERVGKRAL